MSSNAYNLRGSNSNKFGDLNEEEQLQMMEQTSQNVSPTPPSVLFPDRQNLVKCFTTGTNSDDEWSTDGEYDEQCRVKTQKEKGADLIAAEKIQKTATELEEAIFITEELKDLPPDASQEAGMAMLKQIWQNQNAMNQNQKVIINALSTLTQLIGPMCGYMPIVIEKTEKKAKSAARKADPDSEDPWKKYYIIEVNKKEATLKDFSRRQITDLIMKNQDEKWKCPKIGELSLLDPIREALVPYFCIIDQPRKLGWVIGQFLRPRQYFAKYFIPIYKEIGDKTKSRESNNRKNVSGYESSLIADLLLFCGGYLIVQRPTQQKTTNNNTLDFLNMCREGINAQGTTTNGKPNYTNHMAHVDDFVPLLERQQYKLAFQQELDNINAQKKQHRKEQKEAAKQLLQTPTNYGRNKQKHSAANFLGGVVDLFTGPPNKMARASDNGASPRASVSALQRAMANAKSTPTFSPPTIIDEQASTEEIVPNYEADANKENGGGKESNGNSSETG